MSVVFLLLFLCLQRISFRLDLSSCVSKRSACRGGFDQHTDALQAALLLTPTSDLCVAKGTHGVSVGIVEVLHNLTFVLQFLMIKTETVGYLQYAVH